MGFLAVGIILCYLKIYRIERRMKEMTSKNINLTGKKRGSDSCVYVDNLVDLVDFFPQNR